jgi:2-haloacid dehalogenase
MPKKKSKMPVLAFDVYGTLIDPLGMEAHLQETFGERAKEATALWRSKQLEYSFRRALMRKYVNFDVCTAQALDFVTAQLGIPLAEQEKRRLLAEYLRLPAYPDVAAGLKTLQKQGFRMVAFSNGTERSVRALLKEAVILERFSGIVSVDPLRTFKPNPAVYEHLAKHVRRPKKSIWVISSNSFDVIGAKACGLRAAWVQRDPKVVLDPWGFSPDLVLHSLEELPGKLMMS